MTEYEVYCKDNIVSVFKYGILTDRHKALQLYIGTCLCGKHDLLYPGVVVANLDIDPGHVPLPAAHAPADHPGQLPDPADIADQGAAPVPLAGVLPLLAPGTQEPRV